MIEKSQNALGEIWHELLLTLTFLVAERTQQYANIQDTNIIAMHGKRVEHTRSTWVDV